MFSTISTGMLTESTHFFVYDLTGPVIAQLIATSARKAAVLRQEVKKMGTFGDTV